MFISGSKFCVLEGISGRSGGSGSGSVMCVLSGVFRCRGYSSVSRSISSSMSSGVFSICIMCSREWGCVGVSSIDWCVLVFVCF